MNKLDNLFLNRLKITYGWNLISNVLNFGSILFASSLLSINKEIFSIFSLVFSIYFLIGYFDLGFTSASVKFYSENYKTKSIKQFQILGFIFFIFTILGAIFGSIFLFMANNSYITNGLEDETLTVFKNLCYVSAIFSFSIAFKKIGDIHFTATVQTYIQHKAIALASFLKIFAIYLFFVYFDYAVIEYFLFFLFIDFLVNAYLFLKVISLEHLIKFFRKYVRFHPNIYIEQKSLAYTTVIGSLVAIICFESDIIIGEFLKLENIFLISAIYFLITPLKRIISILFIPLFPRMNHYYGAKDLASVKWLFSSTMNLLMMISPLFGVAFLLGPDLIHYVYGSGYSLSINYLSIAIICYFFVFLSNPIISLLRTFLKVKALTQINFVQPIIFLVILFSTYEQYGLYSIFIAKLVSTILAVILMSYFVLEIDTNIFRQVIKNIVFFLIPIIIYYAQSIFLFSYESDDKFDIGKYSSILLSLFLIYFFALYFKNPLNNFLDAYNQGLKK